MCFVLRRVIPKRWRSNNSSLPANFFALPWAEKLDRHFNTKANEVFFPVERRFSVELRADSAFAKSTSTGTSVVRETGRHARHRLTGRRISNVGFQLLAYSLMEASKRLTLFLWNDHSQVPHRSPNVPTQANRVTAAQRTCQQAASLASPTSWRWQSAVTI